MARYKKGLTFIIRSLSLSRQLPLFLFFALQLFANPQNPDITLGWAHLENTAETLKITTGDKTIINWQSFSIGAKESTKFLQPTAKAIVLNRVVDFHPSELFGSLEANGRMILINPFGVLIGKEASVKAASFLASTLDIHDQLFEDEYFHFIGESNETVVNLGKITAWDGDVQLIGKFVENHGSIEAQNGMSALVATKELILLPDKENPIYLRPHQEQNSEYLLIDRLEKEGNPYQTVFSHSNKEDALSFREANGEIYLDLPSSLKIDGTVCAKKQDGTGGSVYLFGDEIDIKKNSVIDVSDQFGGGEVLIGGDFQGRNALYASNLGVFVEKGAKIKADALQKGDGGKVILWSDGATAFRGKISAKGGVEGGDGGLVQVAGIQYLRYRGHVDVSAPNGETGTLLMAPTIIHME